MAFVKIKTENVRNEGGSSFITTSGIYDVNLRAAEVKGTDGGATQINYIFDKAMSYGNTVLGRNGQPTFGMAILESLGVILGEEVLSDPEPVNVKFKKDTKELMCIPELLDVDVKVWLQIGYSKYKGEIREKVTVKRFYRASDGASGSEVLALADGEDIKPGTQLEKDQAYASEIKYEDCTAEEVAAWKKSQASGNKPQPSTAAANSAKAAFPRRSV